MAPQTSTRLTYEDFLELPSDGKHYEIIEGELFVNPAPLIRHQRICGQLSDALRHYFRTHGGGEAFYAPVDVVLAEDSVVEPDVVVVTQARASLVGEKNIAGPPDLVIEVLSEGSRRKDEIIKRKLYEKYGVDEYWIVDPVIDTIKIYRRVNDAFVRVAELSNETGGAITSPLLPEFTLDISIVFSV